MKPVLCRVLDKSVKGPSRCGSMETRVDAPPPPVLWVAVFMWGKCRELPLGNLFLVWITAISYIRNIFLKLKFKCPPQSGSLWSQKSQGTIWLRREDCVFQQKDQKSVFGKKQLKPQSLLSLLMLKKKKKAENLPAWKYFLLINCHKCDAIKLRVSLVNFKVISAHCEAPPNLF